MKFLSAYLLFLFLMMTVLTSCLRTEEWELPSGFCESSTKANTTFQNVFDLYQGSTSKILEDLILEGYVTSSDEKGNFFNTIHIQDKAINPIHGIQIEVDLRDSYLRFYPGDKVSIHLQGLYLGRTKGIFKLGSVFTSFGNLSVGRIPTHAVKNHIKRFCDQSVTLTPKQTSIEELQFQSPNTLIEIDKVEFSEEELGQAFAVTGETTKRKLINCNDQNILLINSGYADFSDEILPEGMGSVTGIYYPENGVPQLIVRSLTDLNLTNERCADLITEFTSEFLFISEIADPDNASSARFVELYYSGPDSLSLTGWHLDRYTNDNNTLGSTIDLSDFVLYSDQTIVLASDAEAFELFYGFVPTLEAGLNSPADSNGDDNLVLVDPFGTIIDIFGVVGEDGSGTNHEFEDGRALRNFTIQRGNPVFTFSEWTVYNDTGAEGTINQPQMAPQDFSPGTRE